MTSDPHYSNQAESFLVVRSGPDLFLLDLHGVRRVLDNVTIYPSPFMGQGILGLARFGGEPLVVLSLESLASAGSGTRQTRRTVVVVNAGNLDQGQRLALAVDEVLEILSLDLDDIYETCEHLISAPINLDGRTMRRVNLGGFAGQAGSVLNPESIKRSDT